MKTLDYNDSFTVQAEPSKVFPLLCPIREYEWIEKWSCELIHSTTGYASQDCVFRTDFRGEGPLVWVVSRYEPPQRIEFSCVHENFVMRLAIALEQSSEGATTLHWKRKFIAISEAGERWMGTQGDEQHRAMMHMLEKSLGHYLQTGRMLVDVHP